MSRPGSKPTSAVHALHLAAEGCMECGRKQNGLPVFLPEGRLL
ncbi:hypothetical protein KNP414_07024 [Paenibacillus mucilaginosus KNP414]|uniref:Uncharacterized protein n=1 Tax=Paenibacillus mucilaginosus (strain KNP414) TaxID=1036673 RepID=F8FKE3_PAEMK|nr:hypothetical protein KNP414_07024 [Paenibacillus mucilaginosus KNP414]